MNNQEVRAVTAAEERGWRFILQHPTATPAAVAAGASISEDLAEQLLARIGTPPAVRGHWTPIWELANRAVAQASEGRKFDDGKPRYDLLPPEMLEAAAAVLTYGANKYGERNWEAGMAWGRPFAALMRHMWAWWRGEDSDPETGYSHLWHALCCIAFLVAYEARGAGTDDRPEGGV